jgi:phage terminase small subunit
MPLNPRQTLFVKEYVVCKNATEAAKRAGYSEKTAYASGKENLHKPLIRAAIDKELNKLYAAVDITAKRVIEELSKIALADMTDLTATARMRMNDKVKSLEILAKHFKLLTDVQEVTGKDGGPQVIITLPQNGFEGE